MISVQTKTITLGADCIGTVVVRNTAEACIFKMKANVQEAIEAKPAHGLIKRNGQTLISVRYKGKIIELDKIKLKIYWLPMPSEESAVPGLLSQSYKRIKMQGRSNEQSLTLTFQFKPLDDSNSMQGFRFKQQSEIPLISQRTDSKKSGVNQNIESPKLIKEAVRQTATNKIERLNGFQAGSMLKIAFIAFLLGISFGIKIARLQVLEGSILS